MISFGFLRTREAFVSSLRFARSLFLAILMTLLYLDALPGLQAGPGGTAVSTGSYKANLEKTYRRAWKIVRENAMHEEKLAQLESWEHRFDGKLVSLQATGYAISKMVDSLNDGYTYFRDQTATSETQQQLNESGVVSAQLIDGRVGCITIHSFQSQQTACELHEAMQQLQSAESLVLNLCDNQGGYVDQAHKAFSMFVESGVFSAMRGRMHGRLFTERLAVTPDGLLTTENGVDSQSPRYPNMLENKPLIILVNRNTRSAAEALAGALRDHHRALILGERTYGKAIVQKDFSLDDGTSITIAVGCSFLPSGQNINRSGLRPDVCMTLNTSEQSWLQRAAQSLDAANEQMLKQSVLESNQVIGSRL